VLMPHRGIEHRQGRNGPWPRLTSRVLGNRTADVPRLPLRRALTQPRPVIRVRYAIPVLWSVCVLVCLTIAAGDALVLYVIFAAYRAGLIAERPEEIAAVEKLLSLTANNLAFWVVVAVFNAILIAAVILLICQVRSIRARPGNS
jgi:hypothetical protein